MQVYNNCINNQHNKIRTVYSHATAQGAASLPSRYSGGRGEPPAMLQRRAWKASRWATAEAAASLPMGYSGGRGKPPARRLLKRRNKPPALLEWRVQQTSCHITAEDTANPPLCYSRGAARLQPYYSGMHSKPQAIFHCRAQQDSGYTTEEVVVRLW